MGQFIDEAMIEVRSGDGGNGAIAWRREKYEPMGGPAGGNGGRGGSVYLVSSHDLNTLFDFRIRTRYEAPNGARGQSKSCHGKAGKDLEIRVPVGTVVMDLQSAAIVCDMHKAGMKVLIAEGGRGGRGNKMMASATNRAPHYCEPGEAGIERKLKLELKLIADIGVVGLPNAGKSTFLSVISQAKPKIADYPFSTLEPMLGVVKRPSGKAIVVADVPGLIEGASRGVGLGHKFLKHLERTRLLIHLIDVQAEDPVADLKTINNELSLYRQELAMLPRVVALNKCDLLDEQHIEEIKKLVECAAGQEVLSFSCATKQGLEKLLQKGEETLSKIAVKEPEDYGEQNLEQRKLSDPDAFQHINASFSVTRRRNVFLLEGDRVERLVKVTDLKSPESMHHLYGILRAMGVIDLLINEGAKDDSEIIVAGISFTLGMELS